MSLYGSELGKANLWLEQCLLRRVKALALGDLILPLSCDYQSLGSCV